MAGDWIKMRGNLWDDPRVAKLCDLTDQSEAAIIGGLYWLWATADQHTEDGTMPGLTLRQIDRKTGIQGLGGALCVIGWLVDSPDGVTVAKFEEHNGTSAKKRCQTAKRVASHRGGNADETQDDASGNAASVTGALAREEKRREEEEKDLSTRKEREQADADARARLEAEGFKPTAAGAVCKAMRQAGLMSSNPGDPRLLALLAQGATEAEFVGIAAEAYAGGKGFAWVLAVLQKRRTEAAAINLAPAVQAVDVGRIAVEKTANDLAALDAHAALAQTPEAHAARRAAMARVRPQQEAA